jgi:hypothetical protein
MVRSSDGADAGARKLGSASTARVEIRPACGAVSALVWFFILETLLHEVSADVHDYSLGTALTPRRPGPGRAYEKMSTTAAGLVVLAWTVVFCAAAAAIDRRRDVE